MNQQIAHRNVGVAQVGAEDVFAEEFSKFAAGRMTAEQLSADLILDIPDAAADRRLLDAEILRRAPEAAAFRSGDDVTHMA